MGGEGNATPEQVAQWEAEPLLPPESMSEKFNAVKRYFAGGTKTMLAGNYSYSFLCLPSFCPWKKGGHQVSFTPSNTTGIADMSSQKPKLSSHLLFEEAEVKV